MCSRSPCLLNCIDNKDVLSNNFYETLVLSTRGRVQLMMKKKLMMNMNRSQKMEQCEESDEEYES